LILGGGLVAFAVALVVILGWTAQYLAAWIPFSFEHEMAATYVEKLDEETTPTQVYLQELVDGLSEEMQLPPGMKITAHYIDNDTINAFATLGGHIVIFRGLLEVSPNENALAMVVAHEIAHVKHRDPIVALGRGVLIGSVLAVLTGASGNSMAGRILGDTGLLTNLHFSRNQESKADRAALEALAGYYGHVGGATKIFEYFQEQEKQGMSLPELFQTHPAAENRIDSLQSITIEQSWPLEGELTKLQKL
jgi:predicted Zn-dependent protease